MLIPHFLFFFFFSSCDGREAINVLLWAPHCQRVSFDTSKKTEKRRFFCQQFFMLLQKRLGVFSSILDRLKRESVERYTCM
jgi:hypothetical protein